MASLKEMRNRIGSVKATQKITKAMQMVAAAKLKRAQDQAESARPYAARMAAVIANLARGVSGDGAPRASGSPRSWPPARTSRSSPSAARRATSCAASTATA